LVETDSLTIQTIGSSLRGVVDLNDNAMLIHNPDAATAASVVTTVESYIENTNNGGFASGAWNGWGIDSTTAHNNGSVLATAVGNKLNAGPTGAAINNVWFGQRVTATDVLLEYTYVGDTNLDGSVDVSDLGNVSTNYGVTGGATWAQGDVNYDGNVDVGDLGATAGNYAGVPRPNLSPANENQGFSFVLPGSDILAKTSITTITSWTTRWGDGLSSTITTGANWPNATASHPYTGWSGYGHVISMTVNGTDANNVAKSFEIPHVEAFVLPAAPTNPTAVGVAPTKIDLSWIDHSAIETSYVIDYSADAGANWTTIPDLPANSQTYRVDGLAVNAPYLFRVHAIAPGGRSAGANTAAPVSTLAVSPLNAVTVVVPNISATAGQAYSSTVATFATTNVLPANLRAFIDWGDSGITDGTITSIGGNAYQITASHTYDYPMPQGSTSI